MNKILEVRNLSKSFSGLKAVVDVSFHIMEGEIYGIIGPNGAGKTTIFNLITKVYPLSGGEIFFEGKRIDHYRLPSSVCKAGIGRTFQVVRPFGNMSVLENVMVGAFNTTAKIPEAKEIAHDAMEKAAIIDKKKLLAKSLTIVDRKRLEVARALAVKPKLLLLDEVMAGLNPTEVEEILPLVSDLRKHGITILMIEHIMAAMMKLSDRILVLNHGEMLAEGTPGEVTSNQKVIEAYLGGNH